MEPNFNTYAKARYYRQKMYNPKNYEIIKLWGEYHVVYKPNKEKWAREMGVEIIDE